VCVCVASRYTPTAAENFPASQPVQAAELVCAVKPENFPASQLVQAAELVCAVKPENFPASQLVHAVAPTAAENLPALTVDAGGRPRIWRVFSC